MTNPVAALAEMPCEKPDPLGHKCTTYIANTLLLCFPCRAYVLVHALGYPAEWIAKHEPDLAAIARLRAENKTLREACVTALQEMNTITASTNEGNWPRPSLKVFDKLRAALADREEV